MKNLVPRILRRRGRTRPSPVSAIDPADVLLGLINAAIADGDAHLIGETAELPEDPAACGWDVTPDRTPRPGGRCIGVAAGGSGCGRRVYLFPVAAYTAAEDAAARLGVTMPMPHPQASAALAARRLIIVDPVDGGPVWRRLRTATGRVWDMAADILLVTPDLDAIPPSRTRPSDSKGH